MAVHCADEKPVRFVGMMNCDTKPYKLALRHRAYARNVGEAGRDARPAQDRRYRRHGLAARSPRLADLAGERPFLSSMVVQALTWVVCSCERRFAELPSEHFNVHRQITGREKRIVIARRGMPAYRKGRTYGCSHKSYLYGEG